MFFEWDEGKNSINIAKHGIDFLEAIKIFSGYTLTFEDDSEHYSEHREISLGEIDGSIVVFVSHTDRDGATRIISARKANSKERKKYYGQNHSS